MVISSRSALFLRQGWLSESAPASAVMSICKRVQSAILSASFCVYVCVFVTLRITAHSGHVILGIICHSNCSSEGGIDGTYYENL